MLSQHQAIGAGLRERERAREFTRAGYKAFASLSVRECHLPVEAERSFGFRASLGATGWLTLAETVTVNGPSPAYVTIPGDACVQVARHTGRSGTQLGRLFIAAIADATPDFLPVAPGSSCRDAKRDAIGGLIQSRSVRRHVPCRTEYG